MALLLREADVEALVDMPAVLAAVERVTRDLGSGEAANQPRRRVHPPGGSLNVMFASDPGGGYHGLKSYSIGGGRARFLLLLYRVADGGLEALIEADLLGAYRTGAATGVAARALARPATRRVGLIGSGWQARTQAMGMAAALPDLEFTVFSRDARRRAAFASWIEETLGRPARAAASAAEAVRGADVVITMTTAKDPVVAAADVAPGALVVGAGSNRAANAELPADLLRAAGLVVVDQRAAAELESGDLLRAGHPIEQTVELGEVLAGRHPGREAADQTVVFESHGLAVWDLAAGAVIVARAREAGRGEEVRIFA